VLQPQGQDWKERQKTVARVVNHQSETHTEPEVGGLGAAEYLCGVDD